MGAATGAGRGASAGAEAALAVAPTRGPAATVSPCVEGTARRPPNPRNNIGVSTMTIAVRKSARNVRLSMRASASFQRLRDRIIPARAEWVTPRDAPNRQPSTARRAMLFDRLDRVRGATRKITTGRGQKLAQAYLIATDGENEEHAHGGSRITSRSPAAGRSFGGTAPPRLVGAIAREAGR